MLYEIRLEMAEWRRYERFTAIEKNDPAQLGDKAEWIKFMAKNLHKWYKQMVFEVMQKNKLTE